MANRAGSASSVATAQQTSMEVTLEAVQCDYSDSALPRDSFDTLVIVLVGRGNNKKEFQVHRNLLAHHSYNFQQLLKDDADHFIGLRDDDPAVFETVLYWMYTARFWPSKTSKDGKIPLTFLHTLDVHFFATENMMQGLQNATLTLLYQLSVEVRTVPFSVAKLIYERTTAHATLKRFLLDIAVNSWAFNIKSNTWYMQLPKELFMDVLNKLKEEKKVPGLEIDKARWIEEMKKNFCHKYHEHST